MSTFAEAIAHSTPADTILLILRARKVFRTQLSPDELVKTDTKRVRKAMAYLYSLPFDPLAPLGSDKQREEAKREMTRLLVQWCDSRGINPGI